MPGQLYASSLSGEWLGRIPNLSGIPAPPPAPKRSSQPFLPALAVATGARPTGTAFVTSLLESGWNSRGPNVPLGRDLPERLMLLEPLERGEHAYAGAGADELLARADIYVGLASAGWEREMLPRVAELGIPAVVGSKGLEERDLGWLAEVSRRIPWVWEPSFALGVVWLRDRVHNRPSVPPSPTGPAQGLPLGSPVLAPPPVAGLAPIPLANPAISGAHLFPRLGGMLSDREASTNGLAQAVEWIWERRATLSPGRYRLSDIVSSKFGGRPLHG